LAVARLEREDVGRLLDPAALEEHLDLLVAEPLDVEGAARGEVLQVLDALERARELARAAEAHALLARRIDLAPDRRVQRAWALGREFVILVAARLLVDDAEHLRDHVAGALNLHRIADAHPEPRDLVG